MGSWNKGWDKVFKNQIWGKYPAEPIIRFVSKNYPDKKINSKLKVLEVGCGTGANLWFLSKNNFQTFGIDGSVVALKSAKKLLREFNSNAKLTKGDIISLPYKDNTFDLIIDMECIYANSEFHTRKILDEIYRVMKPGSFFLSISFSTKTTGYNSGKRYKNEKNTFTGLKNGPLKKDYSLIRFLDKGSIKRIYSNFKILNIDKVSRTYNNLSNNIEEWIISLKKNNE